MCANKKFAPTLRITAMAANDDTKPRSILDALEAGEKADGGGGGAGYVGKVLTEIGWKVFVQGLSNEESFFPYDPFSDASRAEALADAKRAVPAGGKRPNSAIQFTLFKGSVKNRDVSGWKGDRVFVTPQWTESYKQIIKPAIVALAAQGVDYQFGQEYWMRLGFKAEPTGRVRKNIKYTENGTEPENVAELIAFPSQIFATEEEAEAAAGQDPATEFSNGNSNIAEDPLTTMETDAEFLAALKAVAKKPKSQHDKLLLQLAGEYVANDDEYNQSVLPRLRTLAGIG